MNTLFNIRIILMAFMAVVLFSCASNQYSNHGTSSDRTGTNGATNGTGKPPKGRSHNVNY